MDLRWEILAPYAKLFVTGTWMTVQLTVIALVFGLMAGLMIGLVTAQPQQGLKQLLRWLFKAYVGFFRGTPLFVQIAPRVFAIAGRNVDAEALARALHRQATAAAHRYGRSAPDQ